MALKFWSSSNNVLLFLRRQYLIDKRATDYNPPNLNNNMDGYLRHMNVHLATIICKAVFERDLALLTIEMPKSKVVEIVQDVRVTFPDILGTVGMGTIALMVYSALQ